MILKGLCFFLLGVFITTYALSLQEPKKTPNEIVNSLVRKGTC